MVMASAGVNNMPEGPIDSEECRLRRRRRLDPRRYVHAASASSSAPVPAEEGEALSPPPSSSSSSSSSEESSQDGAEAEVSGAADAARVAPKLPAEAEVSGAADAARVAPKLPAGASTAAASWPVAFGSVALAGRLREMEDTVSLHPSFCAWADGSPMHFFAVFDGHGGPHAAALCREQMHVILAEELAGAAAAFNRSQSSEQEQLARAAAAFNRSQSSEQEQLAGAAAAFNRSQSSEQEQLAGAAAAFNRSQSSEQEQLAGAAAAFNRSQSSEQEQLAGAAAAFNRSQSSEQEQLAGAAAAFNRSQSSEQEQLAGAAAAFNRSQSSEQEQLAGAAAAFNRSQSSEQEQLAASSSEQGEEGAWRGALSRSFARADGLAGSACACGRATLPACTCPLSLPHKGAIVGSTAVVALLVRDRLIVANCGDSRAVLSRGGVAVPLSEDQKPDRPDEMARIKAAGGNVMFLNGARVRGILAMSRALGHRLLKPEVICEPEITITERSEDDDCLILASDGLWDVISNKLACDVARQCLEDGSPTRAPAAGSSEAATGSSGGGAPVVCQEEEPRCFRAAALLARLALGRESSDNISVIVVDLKERG